ncbi:hypothetical protein Leryth_000158 [Lithospermum erythrorhizon]|nr:hypothetical protein Leryth_000158 [Lithospermum erythrorhizon]
MAIAKPEELLLMFLILTTLYGTSISTFYKVGDSAGWSIPGSSDYRSWSSSKTFAVGDTILFQYDQQLHNVLLVHLHDYHSCNVNTPIATYTTGNDSFFIGKHGHYLFICGIPGHCEAGQKLDLRVPNS